MIKLLRLQFANKSPEQVAWVVDLLIQAGWTVIGATQGQIPVNLIFQRIDGGEVDFAQELERLSAITPLLKYNPGLNF